MANTPNGFVADRSGWTTPNQPKPLNPSKVETFIQQQRGAGADTRVGKVEESVGGFIANKIQQGQESGNWFTRNATNVGMGVMQGINKVIQPITQGISTTLLTPQAMATKGLNPVESFRFAKKKSKDISMGQAGATIAGPLVAAALPESITPTFAKENFDVFNDKQRNQAFKNEWIGIFASGMTDIAIAATGSKAASIGVKSAKNAVVGPSEIVTAADMATFTARLEDAVTWGTTKTGSAPNGAAIYLDDLVQGKNISELSTNPLVLNTRNPTNTATIVSRLDNHRDVADFLLAQRGDAAAYNRFFTNQALLADHLDDFGLSDLTPTTNFSDMSIAVLDKKFGSRYQAVIDGLKKTDKNFASALDDWNSKLTKANIVERYAPGKFAGYEKMQLTKAKIVDAARTGDLKIFGTDGNSAWKTAVYQSSPYERAVRLISYLGDGTPQGYINVSNPRKLEAANDLRSDLNRIKGLNTPEGREFKNQQVELFMSELTDTGRAKALGMIERNVMLQMAKIYGVRTIGGLDTDKAVLEEIKRWHNSTAERRANVQDYLVANKIIPSEDGTLNLIDDGIISQATEAATLPMLDFGRLEAQIILNTKRLAGGRAPVSTGQVAGAVGFYAGMGVGAILDTANMVFSNLNLLRLAYIPKNSMVDPFMRASMATETVAGLNQAMPGMKNIIYNTGLRAERAARWIPGTPGAKARRLEKETMKKIDLLKGDLNTNLPLQKNAEELLKEAADAVRKAEAAAKRAQAAANKATKANKAAAEAKMFDADYELIQARKIYDDAQDVYDIHSANVRAVANTIESYRNTIKKAVIERGNKADIKRIGQDSDVLVVDGKEYNIQGLADPSVRGALPYMSEIDTAQSYLATAMQTQYSKRVLSRGRTFVKIRRDTGGKAYWNALAHRANREVRQELDMPLGMMMDDTMSDSQIFKWLKTGDTGKEYVFRISQQLRNDGVDVTDEDLLNWITTTRTYLRTLYPDPEVRRLILDRPVTVKEMETLMSGRLDLPEEISGPNVALGDLNWYEGATAVIGGAVQTGWKILSDAETKLVRTPLFLQYTRDEMTSMVRSARLAGFDPTDAVVNHQIRQAAYRTALERVEQTLYSARRMTNGIYLARFAMSFPLAFFNSQAVALRLMAKNPINAYWYNSVANAFDNYEQYEDQDGNTYKSAADAPPGAVLKVSMPLPLGNKLPESIKIFGNEVLRPKDALKAYSDPRGGGLRWNPKQMEFMLADPSVSWFAGVLVSDVVKNGIFASKTWGVYGEEIEKNLREFLGDDFFESSVLYGGYPAEGKPTGNRIQDIMATAKNAIVPSYMESLLAATGFNTDRFLDEAYTNWRVSMAEWERNGRLGAMPTFDNATKAAGNMAFIRAVTQFTLPIATSFDPVTRAATQYYGDLLDMYNGDRAKADGRMIEDWGIDSLAMIGSNQKNIAGLSATEKDISVLRKNPDLLKRIAPNGTKYAEMLSSGYGDISSEYNTAIAAIYKRLKYPGRIDQISTRKTQEEVEAQVISKIGYAELQKAEMYRTSMMMQYGVTSTSAKRYETLGIKQEYNRMVQDLYDTLPGFAKIRNGDRKDFWTMTFPAMKEIANDEKWRRHADGTGSYKWQEIAYWVENADRFHNEMKTPMLSAAAKRDKKARFDQFHYDFLQHASEDFAAFASRWMANMPELEEGLLVDTNE
jgi:hypothetical protein